MLRGAIDYATPSRIGGWLYSEAISLRDHTVLAYLDDICIGTGQIDKFRQDLADAGLGDGFLGFNFPIALERPENLPCVVVRLDGSDAIILQTDCRIAAAAADASMAAAALPTQRLASVKWMREHGWLDQSEYDFLVCMQQFGVYDRMLHQPGRNGVHATPTIADAGTVARELLELYYMEAIELQRETFPSITDLMRFLDRGGWMARPEPVVTLSAGERSRIAVVEGSHRDRLLRMPASGEAAEAPIEYVLGADRLLIINARCQFQGAGPAPAGGLELLHAG